RGVPIVQVQLARVDGAAVPGMWEGPPFDGGITGTCSLTLHHAHGDNVSSGGDGNHRVDSACGSTRRVFHVCASAAGCRDTRIHGQHVYSAVVYFAAAEIPQTFGL